MKSKKIALLLVAVLLLSTLTGCIRVSRSILDAEINEHGELIITYNNGTQDNLGIVVGSDGEDGQDGANGSGGTGITGDSNVPQAVGTALRSSVSIYCTFSGRMQESYSAGSGVIYDLDKKNGNAFIITNYHVVYSSDSSTRDGICDDIQVYLYGGQLEGQELEAEYVGGSAYYDIAVLYVKNSDVLKNSDAQEVTVADSDAVMPGQTAIAVGNAEGEGISATTGIISVDSEHITMTAVDESTEVSTRVMRIDTAVNHGNSGGGLFDDQGRLIGIVNAKIVDSEVENIAYAIPTAVAIGAADNIIDHCYGKSCKTVMRAMLGITIINSASKGVYDADTGLMHIEETIQVHEIDRTSIAKGALLADDILVSITLNGETKQITRQHHVIDMMLNARAGDTVELTVLRDGKEHTVSFDLTSKDLTAY